jgi:hypothetical protein
MREQYIRGGREKTAKFVVTVSGNVGNTGREEGKFVR